MVVHTCKPNTWEAEDRGSTVSFGFCRKTWCSRNVSFHHHKGEGNQIALFISHVKISSLRENKQCVQVVRVCFPVSETFVSCTGFTLYVVVCSEFIKYPVQQSLI